MARIIMWHLSKVEEAKNVDAVVFNDNLAVKDYLDEGFKLQGEYELYLVQGKEMLPSYIES